MPVPINRLEYAGQRAKRVLTTDELGALIEDLESDRVERTVSKANTDKFGQAICAFANDFPSHGRPGYLIIGVTDEGRVSGLAVTDRLLTTLSAMASNVNLEPLPALTVQKYELSEGEVAVVEVTPSDLPPVRYKGRVWIRIGPSRRSASQQEERILPRSGMPVQRTSRARPCPGSESTTWPSTCFASRIYRQPSIPAIIKKTL